jgi:anti-anti-sigma regulatory factor
VAGHRPAAQPDPRLRFDRIAWHEHTAPDGVWIVAVRGALLWPESRLLAERLAAIARCARDGLVLDLSEVTEIDTALVGVLGAAGRQLAWRRRRLALVTDDAEVVATVARAAGGAGLRVVDTREEGLEAVA